MHTHTHICHRCNLVTCGECRCVVGVGVLGHDQQCLLLSRHIGQRRSALPTAAAGFVRAPANFGEWLLARGVFACNGWLFVCLSPLEVRVR